MVDMKSFEKPKLNKEKNPNPMSLLKYISGNYLSLNTPSIVLAVFSVNEVSVLYLYYKGKTNIFHVTLLSMQPYYL